jgi:hypothetical protein
MRPVATDRTGNEGVNKRRKADLLETASRRIT